MLSVIYWIIYWAIFRVLFAALLWRIIWFVHLDLTLVHVTESTPSWLIEGAIFGLIGSVYAILRKRQGLTAEVSITKYWLVFGMMFGSALALINLPKYLQYLLNFLDFHGLQSPLESPIFLALPLLMVSLIPLLAFSFCVYILYWTIFGAIGGVIGGETFRMISLIVQRFIVSRKNIWKVLKITIFIAFFVIALSQFLANFSWKKYELKTQLLYTLNTHLYDINGISNIAISPDQQTLAITSYGHDGITDTMTIKLFNLQTGKELQTLSERGRFQSFVFSPDGQTLAVLNEYRTNLNNYSNNFDDYKTKIQLLNLNLKTGEQHYIPLKSDIRDYDHYLVFNDSGLIFMRVIDEGKIEFFNLQNNERSFHDFNLNIDSKNKEDINNNIDDYTVFTINPKSLILAKTSRNGIEVWDLKTNKLLHTFPIGRLGAWQSMWSLALSPDGKLLAFSGDYRVIRLWNLQTGEVLQTLPAISSCVFDITCGYKSPLHNNFVDSFLIGEVETPITFSPDGKLLISSAYRIKVWRVSP
ncbi:MULTISPECIES: WD40 repeat domain-containing protein [unclassified Coleofasciculus]|uniref:WD40 repeat domain-containing protein n=1 Tax=unclassified Coleofasciculus TaxID=2692782 RepID=UPI00187F125A|nr:MULTISPECIES: hypothetical protein [unclassified Coleofasciculus]MBE9128661.1 hypothetical protein [Coleofasciculus sp. LEGE 07081]MBE9149744.1 hypothetical protein [Coleofasciculus sp. LEGE 07092]